MQTPRGSRPRSVPEHVAPTVDPGEELIRYWEGIAGELQVSVKTAQRYEKEYGLPVRRKRGSRGTVVYALRSELAAWLAAKPAEAANGSTSVDHGPPASGRRSRLRMAAAGAMFVVIAAILIWLLIPGKPPLVAWWRFDEPGGNRVLDRSGNGNDGIVFQGLRRVTGPHGAALAFDGKGYITGIGSANGFPKGNSPFTISAWIETANLPALGGAIFHFGTPGWNPPRANVAWSVTDRGVEFFGFDYGYKMIIGHTPLADGFWHHIAAAYTGGETRRLQLYADGESEASDTAKEPANIGSGSPWTAGVYQGGTTPPFKGLLSDLRLYRRALSHPEIAALYRCGLPQGDIQLPGNLKGYYLPLYRATISQEPGSPGAASVPFRYDGFGRGGVEFALSGGTCALDHLRGATIGQNLRLRVELQLPPDTEGGPFFRARRVAPGDPIEARGNGGYWVRLHTDGAVSLHSLNQSDKAPNRPLTVSQARMGFDASVFHAVEVAVAGTSLRVLLDGIPVRFAGRDALAVPANGRQEGAAGIGFFVRGQPIHSIFARNARIGAS
ncbi:MAG TPA: LamG domain-containing protein [Bryobacteraceae bacterium]|nr:LamG domain-containing protein [Bryobacteraceae bacterium]